MAALAYMLSGGAPVMKKYQYGVTLTTAGIPFTISTTTVAGIVIGTTTGATDFVGMSVDKGLDRLGIAQSTYTTTQGTGSNSALRTVTIIINPDAVWKWIMSNGATNNTALANRTVTTASSGGTAITTSATDWTSPQMLYGYTWGATGANSGDARKITATSSTAGTVVIPFDNATVVGDIFYAAPYCPMMSTAIQLTTSLDQADTSNAVGTGAPFQPIELILRDNTDAGATNSFVLGVAQDHWLMNS